MQLLHLVAFGIVILAVVIFATYGSSFHQSDVNEQGVLVAVRVWA